MLLLYRQGHSQFSSTVKAGDPQLNLPVATDTTYSHTRVNMQLAQGLRLRWVQEFSHCYPGNICLRMPHLSTSFLRTTSASTLLSYTATPKDKEGCLKA